MASDNEQKLAFKSIRLISNLSISVLFLGVVVSFIAGIHALLRPLIDQGLDRSDYHKGALMLLGLSAVGFWYAYRLNLSVELSDDEVIVENRTILSKMRLKLKYSDLKVVQWNVYSHSIHLETSIGQKINLPSVLVLVLGVLNDCSDREGAPASKNYQTIFNLYCEILARKSSA